MAQQPCSVYEAGIADLRAALDEGRSTAVELLDAYLARIAAFDRVPQRRRRHQPRRARRCRGVRRPPGAQARYSGRSTASPTPRRTATWRAG